MDLPELEVLGLSRGETRVYAALLSLGAGGVSGIHEHTGLERRAIYDILNKLLQKGLASYAIEQGKRTYRCSPPGKLREEARRIQDSLSALDQRMPLINEAYEARKPSVASEIYRGKEGMKAIFEDMLTEKENLFIGGGWYLVHELPHFWPQYNKRRIAAKVTWRNLVRSDLKGKPAPEEKYVHVRYLPKDFDKNPIVVFIYGSKVAIVSWGKEIFAFLMESREIAENYKAYHAHLWKYASK